MFDARGRVSTEWRARFAFYSRESFNSALCNDRDRMRAHGNIETVREAGASRLTFCPVIVRSISALQSQVIELNNVYGSDLGFPKPRADFTAPQGREVGEVDYTPPGPFNCSMRSLEASSFRPSRAVIPPVA